MIPKLTPDQYQKLSARTMGKFVNMVEGMQCMALGITGEGGEVADYIKKYLYHNHEWDKEKLMGELGDVLWYVAGMCTIMNWTLEEVMEFNIQKLKRRYPEGFSSEKSINRNE